MAAPIKMDELLVSWLGSDDVYENVLNLIEKYRVQRKQQQAQELMTPPESPKQQQSQQQQQKQQENQNEAEMSSTSSPRAVIIPPFYPLKTATGTTIQRRRQLPRQSETWEPLPAGEQKTTTTTTNKTTTTTTSTTTAPQSSLSSSLSSPEEDEEEQAMLCVRDQVSNLLSEMGVVSSTHDSKYEFSLDAFLRITKEVCRFPSFFNGPLYERILDLWNTNTRTTTTSTATTTTTADDDDDEKDGNSASVVTLAMLEWFWKLEMEPYDPPERFFRLIKQPDQDCILRDDFLPYIKALLNNHPGLEFLSNHAEFQEKYAVTVITRIFYSVNKCHSGRITSRQVRRSDLLEAFSLVDEEEDINKVTRYFSYEHFYVLYCRFWELDHDRDYKITREDLLKYGDHSLSHMIVDRIFDAAPRPFEQEKVDRDFLSYEDFIYFMLSEEDKANDISVRYWFTCVDVDGDAKLNNMEMRSFYAVQLHRMQCMGHEIVPFEDMLCQMMDMIKPKNSDHLIVEDFMQPECAQVSGALFDALFNLNKYLMFEQRDPFVERQKREDEFDTDWDRFACIDYNRLAMEEEAREEEAMEIDWVTVDEDEDEDEAEFTGAVTTEAPF